MPFLFPAAPNSGDNYSYGDITWEYNGYAWEKLDEGTFFQQDNPPAQYVKGDHWFNTLNGKLYIAIEDDSGTIWVEFTGFGGAFNVVIHETTVVNGQTYQVGEFDHYVGVSYDGQPTIVLPFNSPSGKVVVVKDESGKAGEPYKAITIQGSSSDLIDNQSSAIININNASLTFIYRNGWRII
jgi:hypothetical protein